MATSEMEKVLYECMKVGGDAINLEGEQRNYVSTNKVFWVSNINETIISNFVLSLILFRTYMILN